MQQPQPEDLQCYSKAISTQNESIGLSANIIRKYLALTQHFLSMNLKVVFLQKLKIWFWPHLQRRKHQLEQE